MVEIVVGMGVVSIVGGTLLVCYVVDKVFKIREPVQVQENPKRKDLLYIRGVVRKRFDNAINELLAIELLESSHDKGHSIETLNRWARVARSWEEWVGIMRQGL